MPILDSEKNTFVKASHIITCTLKRLKGIFSTSASINLPWDSLGWVPCG
jgi:hypothetical protein